MAQKFVSFIMVVGYILFTGILYVLLGKWHF